MDLEEQIGLITNPLDFTKLCNTVFTEKFGSDFQVIDGTRGDEGNDGYVRPEKRVLAIYCPIKPEKRTDRDYIAKIASDIKKVGGLREEGWDVQRLTFVTPRKLSTKVLRRMAKLAEEHGCEADHVESTYLSGLLYKSPHLVQKFPFLYDHRLEKVIIDAMRRFSATDPSDRPPPEDPRIARSAIERSADLKAVMAIRNRPQTETSKSDLRTIFYRTSDASAKLNCVLGLIQWHSPADEPPAHMVDWCDQGLAIAKAEGARLVEGYLLAQRGMFRSYQWSQEDMAAAQLMRAANRIGVDIHTEEQKTQTVERLCEYEKEFEAAFAAALSVAKELDSANLYAEVLLCVGQAAGLRAIDYRALAMHTEAHAEEGLTRRALLEALHVYSATGQELNRGYALQNLANQLRFFGEQREALALCDEAIEIGKKHEDAALLQSATGLRETIVTGKIPNYLAGERRPLKV